MDFFLLASHCRTGWTPSCYGHWLVLLLSLTTSSNLLQQFFGSLFSESHWDLAGYYPDLFILLKSLSYIIVCFCKQVFKYIKLGGFVWFLGFSKFPNSFRLISRGNFPVTIPKLLDENKSILYPNCWGTPTKFERIPGNSSKLLESWYFFVGYDCILDRSADIVGWSFSNFLSIILQTTANIDTETPKLWTDVLATPVKKFFKWFFLSSLDSQFLQTLEWNTPICSGYSRGLPANSLNFNLGKNRPLIAGWPALCWSVSSAFTTLMFPIGGELV